MATARVSTRSIQVQHILIALVGTVSTILFIASIVLITVGYLNPFGTVGLGILGGGCVIFFSAVLFLCACSIWIKNKYYGDETDCKEKLVGGSNEDITLLKPASNTCSSGHPAVEREKDDIQGDKNNPVTLCSVSTVFSSVSSSSSNILEKLMPNNWQEEDRAGVLDSDVFSTSLTALQHGDMKLQQRLEPTKSSSDLLIGGYAVQNEQKVKDEPKRQLANKAAHNNEKYVFDLPRQRKAVVMDSPGSVPHGNRNKQVEIPLADVKSAKTKETNSSTSKGLCDKNTKLCPVDTSKATEATSQNNGKGNPNHEKDRAPAQRNRNNDKQNIQTADRQGSSITESDPAIQNATRSNKQGIMRKDLITVIAGNLEKKCNANKETEKCNQDRTVIPLQGLSLQSRADQSANVQVPSHVARAEAPRGKALIMKKQVMPGARTNQ